MLVVSYLDIFYWSSGSVQAARCSLSLLSSLPPSLLPSLLPASHSSDFPPSSSLLLTAGLRSLNATKSSQFPQLTSTPSSFSESFHPGIWAPSPVRFEIISLCCSSQYQKNTELILTVIFLTNIMYYKISVRSLIEIHRFKV